MVWGINFAGVLFRGDFDFTGKKTVQEVLAREEAALREIP